MNAPTGITATVLARLLPVLVVAVAGCHGADAEGASGKEADERRWAPGEEWRVSEEPLVTIGELDGPEAIGTVGRLTVQSGLTLLGDGRIAIADGQADEIRVYDASGRRVATMGRAGDGPGEFRGLRGVLAFRGDSLVAWDSSGGFYVGRISIFTADGVFVRIVPTTGVVAALGALPPVRDVVGVTEDGTLLLEPREVVPADWSRPAVGVYREPTLYHRVLASGEPLGSIGPFPGRDYAAMGGSQRNLVTFGHDTRVAVGRRLIYAGDNGTFEIAVHDPGTGDVLRHVRRPYTPRPVTPDDLSGRIALMRTSNARADSMAASLPGVRLPARPDPADIPSRETHPVFNGIIEDADGNLWVRHVTPSADAFQTWSVFDREGAWLGEVDLPLRMSVRAIGSDRIAVVVSGEFSVQYVHVLGLIK